VATRREAQRQKGDKLYLPDCAAAQIGPAIANMRKRLKKIVCQSFYIKVDGYDKSLKKGF